MRKEASFVHFEIDVKYLEDEPKKVTFERPILKMEMLQMKRSLIQTLEIDSQNYIQPAHLNIVLVVSEEKCQQEYILPDSDRLENYHDQLSRCHLIKVTRKEKLPTSTLGCCLSRVQDTRVIVAFIVGLLAFYLAFWLY